MMQQATYKIYVSRSGRLTFGVIASLLITLVSTSLALPPQRLDFGEKPLSAADYDLTKFIDANRIFSFVTNSGTIAMDHTRLFGRASGFYYPFAGDTAALHQSPGNRTLMYAAGLILAGKVDGQLRTAVAAYDRPEFSAGPLDGSPGGGRVFKIDDNSGPGDTDYDEWPSLLGAPVDELGDPKLLGAQTIWTVFNDNDPSLHTNYYGGGTEPLGIEVHQLVWADSTNEEEDNVFYLQYTLYNKGGNLIDSFYITFFADPDLGGANDDLIGCDTVHDLFYAYNGTDADAVYGAVTPAWGGRVLSGPLVSSPGSTAVFAGNTILDYRNIGMTAFSRFINGTEPDTPEKLFAYMQGMDGSTGQPYIDPVGGDTIGYYAPGDAVSRTGWVDAENEDQRVLVSFGPLTLAPGDSQQVELKIGAFVEDDRLYSLSRLRNILDNMIPIDTVPDTVQYAPADSVRVLIEDFGQLYDVKYSPIKSRWLTGVNWGGAYYYGGVDYAMNLYGSALDPAVVPDSFNSVQVRFSNVRTQRAYRYVKGLDGEYSYGGYREVPFTVWDVDNDRKVNAAFLEWEGSNVIDSTWGPDDLVDLGGREILTIFSSDYSGDSESDAEPYYDTLKFVDQADSVDAMYCAWLALCCGRDLSAINDEGVMSFEGQFINHNGEPDSILFQPVEVGASSSQSLVFEAFADNPAQLTLITSDPQAFRVTTSALKYVDIDRQTIAINFYPYREGSFDERLYVYDWASGDLLKTIRLMSKTALPTEVPDEPVVLPDKFVLDQNYPNPFNPSTTIRFSLEMRSTVALEIFNILGRKISTLVDKELPAGSYNVTWDGRTDGGRAAASGVYFYRLKASDGVKTRKMVLLK